VSTPSSAFQAACADLAAHFSPCFSGKASTCEGEQTFIVGKKQKQKKPHPLQAAFQIFVQTL
jgi:hypothetical protein